MTKNYRSFLIINTFGIGDVLFSTPLIRNLSERFPQAKLYYLANRKTAGFMSKHPLIERVFVYERDEFVAAQKVSWLAALKAYSRFISEIRKEKIEAAIDLSLNTPFGFFALLSGIKDRFGLDYKKRGLFLTRKLPIEGFLSKHVAEYYLDVLKLMDIQPRAYPMEVYTDKESAAQADTFLKNNLISGHDLIIGIAPCGGDAFGKDADIKRWPAEKFSGLIERLVNDLKAKVFIFAGPKEKTEIGGIIGGLKNREGVFEFTGSTLTQTTALLEKCSLFIGNDTGPMRFADALRKKIVALFGPVDEKVYGPYPEDPGRAIVLKKDLPCRPCYGKFRLAPCKRDKECLKGISIDEVMAAVKKLLINP
jgi:heptosyltransferase II